MAHRSGKHAVARTGNQGWQATVQDLWSKRPNALKYDEWVLAAYRNKINYRSFQDASKRRLVLDEDAKDDIIQNNRSAILDAIKHRNLESYKAKTNIHIFSWACVLAISIGSGFILSNFATAHLGFSGPIKELFAAGIVYASYVANKIIFRRSTPSVLGKLLYKGNHTGWHFLSRKEVRIYKNINTNDVDTGYYNAQTRDYTTDPHDSVNFTPKQRFILFTSFLCIIVASVISAALSITKVPASLENFSMLTALQLGSAFTPLGWVLAAATFFCTMASLTYAIIRVLDQKDKTQDFKGIFKSGHGLSGMERTEAYVYNFFMLLLTVGLMGLACWGLYSTSLVQSENFMKMLGAASSMAGIITVAVVALLAKGWFTIRATANYLKVIPTVCSAVTMSVIKRCQNFWLSLKNFNTYSEKNGQYKNIEMDILDKQGDDFIGGQDAMLVGINATANAFASSTPNEAGESPLFYGSGSDLFLSWCAGVGAATVSAASATDKFRIKSDRPVLNPDDIYCESRTSPIQSPAAHPAL